MKRSVLFLISLACITLSGTSLHATYYWDIDGATPGCGSATPSGSWADISWSTNAAGDVDTEAFASGGTAVFSAGTDATGEFTISGNATVAGLVFEEGKVIVSGNVSLGTGPITIESGATLSINSSVRIAADTGSVITINGGTLEDTNPGGAGSFVDVNQTIVLNGGGTLSHTVAGVLNIVQTDTTITGTGPLTKEGAGTLAIASKCDYSGATIINNGTLRVRSSSNRLPIGTDVVINSPGVFDPGSTGGMNQRVRSVNGNGNITHSASSTLIINGGVNFPSTIDGVITDGAAFASFTKNGNSALTLNGANDYSGTFTLTGNGSCTVSPGASLCAPDCYVVVTSGTLNLNNAAQTVDRFEGTGGTINLGSGHALTIVQSGDRTNASVINGASGSLTKQGASLLTLAGINTYGGGTTVSAGTMEGAGSSSLGQGNVTVANGATNRLSDAAAMYGSADLLLDEPPSAGTVDLNFSGTNFIRSLYFGATAQATGTWGALGSGAAHEDAAFTGTGFLHVRPATTTDLTDDTGSPTVYGDSVTFTATVTGSSPTGTVQFKDGASDLGSPVALVAGQAQIAVTDLTVGGSPHSITAVYSGDENNALSTSSAVEHSVTGAASATALMSSQNPSASGEDVTFTATVTSGVGTPTGSVVFLASSVPFSTNALVSGSASANKADLPVGTNTVTAEYAAQANWLGSTGGLDQVVNTAVCSATNSILSIADLGGGSFTLNCQGTEGATYYVVTSSDVTAAMSAWTPVAGSTNMAGAGGLWSATVSGAAPAYYRGVAETPCP